MSDVADEPAGEYDATEWEYLETSGERVTTTDLTLEQPRTAVSRYIPSVTYDSEEQTLSLTFRG